MNVSEEITFESFDGKMIPVDEIIALDSVEDLAVLKVKNYQSEHYYSIETYDSSKRIVLAGFPYGAFKVSSDLEPRFMGVGSSGAPFFKGQNLFGIHIRGNIRRNEIIFSILTPVEKLRELLSRPLLSCSSGACVLKELEQIVFKAQKGEKPAQDMLSIMHREGLGMPIDFKKADYWYYRSLLVPEIFEKLFFKSKKLKQNCLQIFR